MRTLLTGFSAFGSVVNNPSERIVAWLEREGAPGHELTTRVLPVSYERAAREIEALLKEGAFDAALLLGVARAETCIRVEQQARLGLSGHGPDVDGKVPVTAAGAQGTPAVYSATFGVEGMVKRLAGAGFAARLSEDAGGYVCNYTYYSALRTIRQAGLSTRCLFLHVPPDEETFSEPPAQGGMPLAQQVVAVQAVLAWLAGEEQG
jgi:pyroglutamyl-peptidase